MAEPMTAVTRIEVRPGDASPYTVQIGSGLLGELVDAVGGATRVALDTRSASSSAA